MTATLDELIAVIDACNTDDPNVVEFRGERGPKELLHGRAMDAWVRRLDVGATEAQQLAARAHHLRRWTRPRSEFPEGRAGYLRWRTAARHAQAEEVRTLLGDAGADDALLVEVSAIVDKQAAGRESQVQTHEDALCLVFLEAQLDDVADRLGDAALVAVVAKTLVKMSPTAIGLAHGLALSSRGQAILDEAVRARQGVVVTDTPRIAPVDVDTLDPRAAELLRSLRFDPEAEDMALFATLAHHPRLLKRWSAFGGLLLAGGTLPHRDREVLILRTAANTGADYEWGHHLPLGRHTGLTDQEMATLAIPSPHPSNPHDALLVRAADELHADNAISDTTWAELAAVYDEQQLIELCMVVGQYHLVAFTLNSLRIRREDGVEGIPR